MHRLLRLLCLLVTLVALRPACAQHGYLDPSRPVNWNAPLNRGLVSWWLALPDQQRGVIFRDLCNRNHGTLTSMDPPTDWVSAKGRPGGFGALDCDGSNDHINLGNNGTLAKTVFTISFWLRTTATSGTPIGWMNTGTSNGWRIYTHSGGSLRWETASSGFSTINTSITTCNDGAWRHFAFSCLGSGAAQQWYINGVADNSGTLAVNIPTTAQVLGAGTATPSFAWAGQLDDVRFHNRVLSAAEVYALYTDSRTHYRETLAWQGPPRYAPQDVTPPANDGNFLPLLSAKNLPRPVDGPIPARWQSAFAQAP